MIKARGEFNGRPMMLLGLSGENVTRLMAGEPIKFDAAELGLPPMTVLIVGGRTEDDIVGDLRAHGLMPPSGRSKLTGNS